MFEKCSRLKPINVHRRTNKVIRKFDTSRLRYVTWLDLKEKTCHQHRPNTINHQPTLYQLDCRLDRPRGKRICLYPHPAVPCLRTAICQPSCLLFVPFNVIYVYLYIIIMKIIIRMIIEMIIVIIIIIIIKTKRKRKRKKSYIMELLYGIRRVHI